MKLIPQKVGQVIRQDKNKYIDFKQIKDSTKAKLIELKKYKMDTTQYPTEQTLCTSRGRYKNMQACGYHPRQDCMANKQVKIVNQASKQGHNIEIWQSNRNNDRQG